MRNDYIKLLDKHKITDGILREFLQNSDIEKSSKHIFDALNASIEQRANQIIILQEIKQKILAETDVVG